jgi:hypothetical protein
MPATIANAKKARIQAKIELGLKPQVIFKEEHVSLRTAQRFATNVHRHGSIQAPKALQQGRQVTSGKHVELSIGEFAKFEEVCVLENWVVTNQ